MQERNETAAINAIEHAHRQSLHAIHLAVEAFGEDREFSVLLARLQDAAMDIETIKNQMVRIKSRNDIERGFK